MEWFAKSLEKVREKRPLVQNITNFVVMNTTANALLAIGAAPVMAHAQNELEDMLKIADSLVINIGTLDDNWLNSMEKAVKLAKALGKNTVLDPVGAGATKLRTETSLKLIEYGDIAVLRGNFGEIAALLGEHGKTRGVDSAIYEEDKAKTLVLTAAKEFDTVVVITGPVDYVSDGKKSYAIYNGHEMLGRVTGTGCMVSALIGAFVAVEEPLKAAVSALVSFGIVAEKAYEEAKYLGSFHVKLYDWLYKIDVDLINKMGKVTEIGP
ncbi:hydroxyethylthiazole kinase [Thermodesulfatator atlanticus]|uniref:hydroxyethylthiazole kinase n=1 Tax=Thermodesulfatator atlanticus TaxID=501497 RepID=UPI0003B539E9|nr:hydroxyethylthiazole kinase [Thermodesulfatator atlanticus]